MENVDSSTGSKQKIISAATVEFARYGLSGSRIDRIAAESGVNKAMTYYYFGSKEKLYQAVLDEHMSRIITGLYGQVGDDTDLETALLIISQLYHQVLAPGDHFSAIFLHEMADGGARLKDTLNRFVSQRGLPGKLLQMIEKGKLAGKFREVDSRQVILAFLGMNLFYLIMSPVANEIWEIEDEHEFRVRRPSALVDLFMRGIVRR